MNNDLISRSELKKAIQNLYDETLDGIVRFGIEKSYDVIDNAPTVELTEEQAIDKLHETGWLIRHDKEMTERPHIIDNCDMNVFEPENYMKERPQGESFRIEDGLKKARRGNYVIYDVDFLLDNLAREVNIMESARQWEAGKGNDND